VTVNISCRGERTRTDWQNRDGFRSSACLLEVSELGFVRYGWGGEWALGRRGPQERFRCDRAAPTRLVHSYTNISDSVFDLEGEINMGDALMNRACRKDVDICSKLNMYLEKNGTVKHYHC
jgi:hypothetical protein